MRRQSKLAAVALILILTTCGGSSLLKSFRVALASSAPLVNSLVSSGVVPQAKATAIISDFDAGAQCGLTLQSEFAAIPKDLSKPEIKRQKYAASLKALQCFRAIVQRQNFASHPRIQNVANIAEGVLASLVIFYSDSGSAAVGSRSADVVIARDEDDLEKKLKAKVDEIERLLKP